MYKISPFSETGAIVEFGQEISPAVHSLVHRAALYIEQNPFDGYVEYAEAYTTLAVFYDPIAVRKSFGSSKSAYKTVEKLLEERLEGSSQVEAPRARVVDIPVYYGDEYGPDLGFVAEHAKLTPEEVVEIHTSGEYLVYMLGFCPGFPYMGGLDKRIAAPRRQSPRLEIPARSIGIAGMQTGGYPIGTPGGWQLIGRTPIELFLPDKNPPTLLSSGDIVHFKSVSKREYDALRSEYGEQD